MQILFSQEFTRKIMVSSFNTLEDANHALSIFNDKRNANFKKLQDTMKFKVMARPSDNLYVIAIEAFTEQRVAIRKSLRDVQFQLQKDIEELGNILKLINIVGAPLALVIILLLTAILFKKRAPKQIPSSTPVIREKKE